MLDLRNFKKMGSTKTHTIFQHPDGHEIHVAHAKLPHEKMEELKTLPSSNKKIGGMAAYAKGGEVKGDDETKEQQPESVMGSGRYADGGTVTDPLADYNQAIQGFRQPPPAPDPALNSYNQSIAPFRADFSGPRPMEEAKPDASNTLQDGSGSKGTDKGSPGYANYPISAPGASQGPGPDLYGTQATSAAYQRADQEMRAGIVGQANAQGAEARAGAAAAGQGANQMANIQATYEQHMNALSQERAAVMQDLQAQHIDPNHYWNSKSTGGKIATAIGMILGGLGGNNVSKFMDDQIAMDVDAQKANIGTKKTILEANLQQFKNMRDATEMTRLMQMDMVKMQLERAAFKSQDPMAKARAQQALAEWDAKMAPIQGSIAARQALTSHVNAGQIDPAVAITALVPKEEQAKATEALGAIRATEDMRKGLHEANQKLNGMFMRGALSPNQRDALINLWAGKLAKESAGRYNADEAKAQVSSMLVGKGDFSQSTQQLKEHQIDQFFDSERDKHDPYLTKHGITVPRPKSSATTPINVGKSYKR